MAQHVGIAVSGGGHRASVWGLGTLMYLVDTGRNTEVAAISSVSGGSITNGVIAHELDYAATDPVQFRRAMRPLLKHVADVGLFFPGKATNKYVAFLFTVLALGIAALGYGIVRLCLEGLTWHVGIALLVSLVILALGIFLLERRSKVVDKALARTYFHRDGKPTPLADVARGVDHVMCSTELQSGRHCYFSPRFVYAYAFGLGKPGDLRLSTAVQASACLPAAFLPRRISASTFGFTGGTVSPTKSHKLVLTDGGVYDNMADQWLVGLDDRIRRIPGLPVTGPGIDEVIVVNGASPVQFVAMPRPLLALVGELTTLLRVNSVMYQVTTQRRRSALVEAWEAIDAAALHGSAPRPGSHRGALVHIAQSPFTTADAYRNETHDAVPTDRARRARAVIALLGDDAATRERWADRARRSTAVDTVLKKLGRTTTIDLLEHSYILTLCNLHVLLDYPLPTALPDRAQFEAVLA